MPILVVSAVSQSYVSIDFAVVVTFDSLVRISCIAIGIAPGSMPPHSTCLEDEGAMIVGFKLVRNGTVPRGGYY